MDTAHRFAPEALYARRAWLYERLFVNGLGFERRLGAWLRRNVDLRSGVAVLDAACGPGTVTRGLLKLAREQRLDGIGWYAVDLAPATLQRFRLWLARHAVQHVRLAIADLRDLRRFPADWPMFDLIVCAFALEHVPRQQVPDVLRQLKQRLAPGGRLVVLVTERTPLTKLMIGRWWHAELFDASQLRQAYAAAGLPAPHLSRFGWSRAIIADLR